MEYDPGNRAVAATILFLPSLAGLFLGGFAANRLWPGQDADFLLGCAGGFALGLLATAILARARLFRPSARLIGRDKSA